MKGNVLYDDNEHIDDVLNVLDTIDSVDGKTIAVTNLYTVPTGKTLILTDIVVRATAADTVAVPPILKVGVTTNYNEWLSSGTLTGLTTAGQGFSLSNFISTTVRQISYSAGQIVGVSITTGATATTLTLSFDVIGYLI